MSIPLAFIHKPCRLMCVNRTVATVDATTTVAEATATATKTAAAAMADAMTTAHLAIVMVVVIVTVEIAVEAAAMAANVHHVHLQQMALAAMAQNQAHLAMLHRAAAMMIVVVTTKRENHEVHSMACVWANKTGVTEQATVFFQHESLGKLHPRSFCWSRLIHVLLQLPFSRCDFSMCY